MRRSTLLFRVFGSCLCGCFTLSLSRLIRTRHTEWSRTVQFKPEESDRKDGGVHLHFMTCWIKAEFSFLTCSSLAIMLHDFTCFMSATVFLSIIIYDGWQADLNGGNKFHGKMCQSFISKVAFESEATWKSNLASEKFKMASVKPAWNEELLGRRTERS